MIDPLINREQDIKKINSPLQHEQGDDDFFVIGARRGLRD